VAPPRRPPGHWLTVRLLTYVACVKGHSRTLAHATHLSDDPSSSKLCSYLGWAESSRRTAST